MIIYYSVWGNSRICAADSGFEYKHVHCVLLLFSCCFFPLQSGSAHECELEARVARLMGSRRTKASDPSLVAPSAPGEGEDKTYLLFTTGSLTYSPHQIGVWGGVSFFSLCVFVFLFLGAFSDVSVCVCVSACTCVG